MWSGSVAPNGTYERGEPIAGPTPGFENNGAAYGLVSLSAAAQTDDAQQVVRAIRAKVVDRQVEVGGPTATLIDTSAAVGDRLPVAILLIALATFVLLFLFTGSIVVPMKALVLNLLMLSAVLGTMVWIFQDGHLAQILGITPAPLNLSMVVLLCCIAFSLSVDYEIFLLSRIKEARDSGLSNNDAIVVGLGRVGRIISSAALLLTITLLSFANGLSFMKMFGIGTALAIVIDATVIRGVVVPAFLRVAGELNWWAPPPLKRLHARIGFSEAPPQTDFPSPSPKQDEETVRLPPMRAPKEPDTVRYPTPTLSTMKRPNDSHRCARLQNPIPSAPKKPRTGNPGGAARGNGEEELAAGRPGCRILRRLAPHEDAHGKYRTRKRPLLGAEDPLHHGGVREVFRSYDFPTAEGVQIGALSRFAADPDFGQHDHLVVVGDEPVRGGCERLLRQLREELTDFSFAVIRAADRAVARFDPLDVVVKVPHSPFGVSGGERGVALVQCLNVLIF